MSGPSFLQPGGLFAGRFRVIRVLGHGGMGTVYEAIHETTGAARALKLMLPQFAEDARFLRRFSQEARISALIDSDHVVQVLDVGFDEPTHSPFLVMELLRGESLAGYVLRKRHLGFFELRAIFTQLFHAICAAHDAGIVHRDLKPENIFLARTRREGAPFTVKILDFGIAKMMAEAQATATVRLGSPLWVAPEQTEANQSAHPSVDLWALGLLAFFCLTGRSYWLRANEETFSIPALMRELLFEPLAPASERADALHASGLLPPGFDAWFARCVHRDPAARFSSSAEARDALLALLPSDENAYIEPLPEMTGAFSRAQFPADFQDILAGEATAVPAPVPSVPAAVASLKEARPSGPGETTQPSEASLLRSDTLADLERLRPTRRYLPLVGVVVALASGLLALALIDTTPPQEDRPTRPLAAEPLARASAAPPPAPPQAESAAPAVASAPRLAEPGRGSEAPPSTIPRGTPPQDRPVQVEQGQGFLSVVCRPYCDSVQIRGRDLGPTPLLRSPLAPGSYTARLLRKGQAPRTVGFTVQRGQTTILRVNLDEPSKPTCKPPYTVDAEGHKRLKPECREL